jgi:hypothetical protein
VRRGGDDFALFLGALASAELEVARVARAVNQPMTEDRKAAIEALRKKEEETAFARSEKSANKKAAKASGLTWKAYKKSLKRAGKVKG